MTADRNASRQWLRPEFEAFVTRQGSALLRLAYLLTGSQHDAEDLLQTALTQLFVKWPRVSAADSVEAYARTVLVNVHVGQRRRRRVVEVELKATHGQPPTGDEAEASVYRDDLARALRSLAPRQRAVLVLRFYEDLSTDETARILNCSVGTVKSQTSDALRHLRGSSAVQLLREVRS